MLEWGRFLQPHSFSTYSRLHLSLNHTKWPTYRRPDLDDRQTNAAQPLILAALHRAECDAADVGERIEAAAADVRQHALAHEQLRVRARHGSLLILQDLAALGVWEVVQHTAHEVDVVT